MGVDRALVAHLFRRAGFGARPAELSYYETRGYERAVEDLVNARPAAEARPGVTEVTAPVQIPAMNLRGRVTPAALTAIQTDWLERMVTTTTPLVERMTLFLHDHFATAFRPNDRIDTPELSAQNALFRKNALGSWRKICHAMIEDVAMSNWLDNNVNVAAHPNENLAREMMELFTLGIGNFTEKDVREAARALTGYQNAYNLTATGPRYHMVFNPALHDDGVKEILGRTGNFMPGDVVDIVLAQPAAPRFLARKLIETFVMPDPASWFVDSIAGTLISKKWALAPALRKIFNSNEFKSARSALVKSPAEFVAGALRSLGRTSDDDLKTGIYWMGRAGQTLYDPPNVGGWPSNMGWLGAGGVLARYNAASVIADRHVNAFVLKKTRAESPDGWAQIFGITNLTATTRNALESYLLAPASLRASNKVRDAAMITLTVASADFSVA